MRLEPNARLFSTTGLRQCLLTALAYGGLLLLSKLTLLHLPWLQFRFASFIPVISGIMFGLPGAAGALVGNLLGGLIGSTPLPIQLGAALLNFFLAYLPFRLWYGWRGSRPLRLICDSVSFARFIFIILLTSFLFSTALSALIDVFYHQGDGLGFGFFILIANNYFFPLLLGLPLLLFWRQHTPVRYYPPKGNSPRYGGLQLPALALLTVLDIGYLVLSQFNALTPAVSAIIFFTNLILLCYICTLPSCCRSSDRDAAYSSLSSKATQLLLIFITSFILLALLPSLLLSQDSVGYFNDPRHWKHFYIILGSVLNAALFFLYFLLRWMERTLSRPLVALNLRARHYMKTGADRKAATETAVAKNEMEVLSQAFGQMSTDISHYISELTTAAEAKHALQAQLDVANQIQQGTLPNLAEVNTTLQSIAPAYLVKGGMQAARHVGGDMFDCYLIDEDHLLVNVGDVAGKGIPAALFAMVTQALLSNSTYDKSTAVSDLSSLVEKVNDALEENNEEVLFVTLWVGVIELSTGKISYVNAGHNPPMLAALNGSGELQLLEEISGPVLGLMPSISYALHHAALSPGQKLLIFTDGLNEAENEAHEFYGDERLRQIFLRANEPEEIMSDIQAFVGEAPPSDDKTYLWIERK